MAKSNYPNGVIESVVPCKGPHSMKASIRECPHDNMLKQKIVTTGGDRCFKCFCQDNPSMNSGAGHSGICIGGSGLIGSKGSPKKKGGSKKTMSARA